MRTWSRALRRFAGLTRLAAALVLGVVVMLAVPAAAPAGPGLRLAGVEERVARVEGIIEQVNSRLHTLEWMVGLSMAWNTLLIGSAVGLLLKYR